MNVGAVNSKLLVNSLYCALQKIFILNIYFHLLKISKAQETQHLRFVREYAQVFVHGHDRFLEARTLLLARSLNLTLGKLFASQNRSCLRSGIPAYFRAKWRLLFI